ncbi:MAG: D-glycero-beta-D-manno-heptose 1-phosphate adenylyltransferase [Leptospiraceae bacterium]|nr:D-glycero-beta-D-manno-heptose 1-phosphate adenylyltransferase [Leptospiraceae bacterium]MDW7975415.1 D-glycero-beta-D-manno-heptose 1-phosphate adenylyltransferase [Leptospiraceae bacterium]
MNYLERIESKLIFQRDHLQEIVSSLKNQNQRIVFTNGCFDILHRGHVYYLAKAKELGDILIIGINSDESVRRLKGQNRPINTLQDRMFLLASLEFVDYVTFFSEETPIELIKVIQPHIHVKGGDYQKEQLPETPIVEQYGGNVKIIPYVKGYSTTNIITRMK